MFSLFFFCFIAVILIAGLIFTTYRKNRNTVHTKYGDLHHSGRSLKEESTTMHSDILPASNSLSEDELDNDNTTTDDESYDRPL